LSQKIDHSIETLIKSQTLKDNKKVEKEDPYKQTINASSALFAQHFSILRELRNYCN